MLRNPYVDPMSLLQVELLGRWREGGREDAQLFDVLLASVKRHRAGPAEHRLGFHEASSLRSTLCSVFSSSETALPLAEMPAS